MAEEFKRFDSQGDFAPVNIRLAKDAQQIPGGEKPMVKLTFVYDCAQTNSKGEYRYEPMWWEATVLDRDGAFASYFEKGDEMALRGHPALRRWGDNNEKISLELVRTEVLAPIALKVAVKERGFEPGKYKGAAAPKKGGKTPPKGAQKPARKVVDLDDDDLPAEE